MIRNLCLLAVAGLIPVLLPSCSVFDSQPEEELPVVYMGIGEVSPAPLAPAPDTPAPDTPVAAPGTPTMKITGWSSGSRGGGGRGIGMRHAVKPPPEEAPDPDPDPDPEVIRTVAWPAFSETLSGPNLLRIVNPNDVELTVGLRSEGGGGMDLSVPSDDRVEVWVPDGRYATWFRYSSDPTGIYRGQSFTLSGHGAEIQVVPASNAVPAMERLN